MRHQKKLQPNIKKISKRVTYTPQKTRYLIILFNTSSINTCHESF